MGEESGGENNSSREVLNILRRATDLLMMMVAEFVMLVCDKLTHTHVHMEAHKHPTFLEAVERAPITCLFYSSPSFQNLLRSVAALSHSPPPQPFQITPIPFLCPPSLPFPAAAHKHILEVCPLSANSGYRVPRARTNGSSRQQPALPLLTAVVVFAALWVFSVFLPLPVSPPASLHSDGWMDGKRERRDTLE